MSNIIELERFELSNHERKFFGLRSIESHWDKVSLDSQIDVYFDGDKIEKVVGNGVGYFIEYDVEINTRERKILLPKTTRGKEQKISASKVSKIKGSGAQFTASLFRGGVHVYNNRTNSFFIKSFPEEGEMKSFDNVKTWIQKYIRNVPDDHFEWLETELNSERKTINAKKGDIIAFKISGAEWAFARVLQNTYDEMQKLQNDFPLFRWHPRSLIVAPYAWYATSLKVDIHSLVTKETLPSLCIFDIEVYRGQMPVIGNLPLSSADKKIPYPSENGTLFTIPYSKSDIQTFMDKNK
jgi:hypothetical protein